jgi:hypothetical protein
VAVQYSDDDAPEGSSVPHVPLCAIVTLHILPAHDKAAEALQEKLKELETLREVVPVLASVAPSLSGLDTALAQLSTLFKARIDAEIESSVGVGAGASADVGADAGGAGCVGAAAGVGAGTGVDADAGGGDVGADVGADRVDPGSFGVHVGTRKERGTSGEGHL